MRKKGSGETKARAGEVIEFAAEDASPSATSASYSSWFAAEDAAKFEPAAEEPAIETAQADEREISPAFKLLSEPTLPPLERENRARLQMQSPNRLYFYWSLKDNPYKNLNRLLGAQASNYTLVLKLVDVRTEEETVQPADPEGSWWFDVEGDASYRAEIGMYAANRPYVRILFSNTVETPRRGPSPRPAEASAWKVTAQKFSQVLDVAGFSRDAFDVALAGDEHEESDAAAREAFADYFGEPHPTVSNGFTPADIRLVLLTFAAGGALASLRGRIGPALFAFLESSPTGVDPERASSVLGKRYEIETDEFEEEAEPAATVFGASAVNFPRRVRTRRHITDYSPLSSISVASS
jgi:hypothetical protein